MHRRRQKQGDPARQHHADHRQHKRRAQNGSGDDAPCLALEPQLIGRGELTIALCIAGQQFGVVTCFANSGYEVGGAKHAGHAPHRGLLCGEVDIGLRDAWHVSQRLFDSACAGGAGHAGNRELALLLDDIVACPLDRFRERLGIRAGGIVANIGPFIGEIDRGLHTGQRRERLFHTPGAGGAGHSLDIERHVRQIS